MVAFAFVHNQPLWFCKYNNPNRNLSSRVTTQVTTFLNKSENRQNSLKFILRYYSAFCLNKPFKFIRIHSETQVLVAPPLKQDKSLKFSDFFLYIYPVVCPKYARKFFILLTLFIPSFIIGHIGSLASHPKITPFRTILIISCPKMKHHIGFISAYPYR